MNYGVETMLGAIVGDIIGSRFEQRNTNSKNFELFTDKCHFTDDSVMTLAVADALLESNSGDTDLTRLLVNKMQTIGLKHPFVGYGSRFHSWLYEKNTEPIGSFGNGSAMRVSACGWLGKDLEEVKMLARKSAEVTHNHPEGIKGAEVVAAAIYLARTGKSKEEIKNYIVENYSSLDGMSPECWNIDFCKKFYYDLNFKLEDLKPVYYFDITCQGSVPEAIEAFLEADSFEDAIRTAVAIGGDSDTIAAIAGSIAEAFYGIPDSISSKAISYLTPDLLGILRPFLNLQIQRKQLVSSDFEIN